MRRIQIEGLILIADALGDDVEKEADQLLEAVNLALQQALPNTCPQLGREELNAKYMDDERIQKGFKVAAVSRNRNSFGLRSMVVVARDGEAYRVLSNDLNLKREGEVLWAEELDGRWNFAALGYEVPERLPKATAEVVAAVWGREEKHGEINEL